MMYFAQMQRNRVAFVKSNVLTLLLRITKNRYTEEYYEHRNHKKPGCYCR